jgi:hypothetical protein
VDRRLVLSRLAYGVLAIVFALALQQLLNSPLLRVDRVEVEGQRLLAREEILQAAGVAQQSIFSVDKRRVAESLLALGVVRQVDVTTILPGTVVLRVVEKEPRYVWRTAASGYLIDEEGVVLAETQGTASFPGLREIDGEPRRRGDKVDLRLLQAVSQLGVLWPVDLGKDYVCEYTSNGLAAINGGWRAEFGDGSDLEAKVLALAAIAAHVEETGGALSVVDLRNVERPYFTLHE